MEYLNFLEANCQNCYKCLRTCKVKAIKIEEKQARIIPDLCVGCGECFNICPQNAKSVKTDIAQVKNLINMGETLVVSLAPSFPSVDNFLDPLQYITALKKLGFHRIEETTIGAVKVSEAYNKDYFSDQQHVITSSCPTVNFLVSKYYNDKVKYLSQVVSPMMAHNKLIKKDNSNVFTVFVGPCISKKEETKVCTSKESCIDFVITFDDIREWLKEEAINPLLLDPTPFDKTSTQKSRWYPLSGGVEKATLDHRTERRVIKVDGMSRCMQLLESLDEINGNTWIEMNACEEGCINGYGNSLSPLNIHKRIENVVNYISTSNDDKKKLEEVDIAYDYSIFEQITKTTHTEQEIRYVLEKTGKFTTKDELNCGSCGYNTCRDKAIAVLEKKAELEMCVPYMRMLSEDMSSVIIENTPNNIVVTNNLFEIVEFNPTSVSTFKVSKKNALGKNITDVMGKNIFYDFKYDKSKTIIKKVVFNDIQKTMIVSIQHIENHDLYLGILQDITREERRKQQEQKTSIEALEMAQDVIDKQMIVAHEIASLLGETTAETKVTLSKLKKLFNEKD